MIAVFENVTIYTAIASLGLLPSGVNLDLPPANVNELDGRCVSGYPFTEEDQAFLLSFEGVYLTDSMPPDWYYPDC